MQNPPLISIALCTYNGARHLKTQMESLLAQDWENLEIVVVDDGSTDGTRELLHEYASGDPRIAVHLNAENLGFVKNFQKAFSLTQGEFIAPCDQDDWWHPQKLRGLHAALGDRALAYCDSELMDEAGQPLGRRVSDVIRMHEGKDPVVYVFGNSVSGHAMLVRRSLVERAHPFPDGFFHDWWLAFAAASTDGVIYVPETWVNYRQHAAAQTDLSGRSKRRSAGPSRWNELNRRGSWIRILAQFPSPHQSYFRDLLSAWNEWTTSWFCPRLASLLLERRKSLFANKRRERENQVSRSLRYFWGLRLRSLLIPWRYRREPEMPSHGA
jgi:glycosyltransferase involved in cell wall biosynthesis